MNLAHAVACNLVHELVPGGMVGSVIGYSPIYPLTRCRNVRADSACEFSSAGGAVSGSGCWARYAFTQYPSELSLISNSRATCAIGRPPCTTSWTASALNSSVNFLRFVDISACRSFLVTTVYKKCHTLLRRGFG